MYKNKIYGCIYGAMLGDALGAPTEMRTREQILNKFGGEVRSFITPPDDVFAKGKKPGEVTDDFSLAFYLYRELVNSHLKVSDVLAINAVIKWSEDSAFYPRFAGPTTMTAVDKLLKGEVFDPALELGLVNYNNLITNGAAMKIFPIGLLNSNLDTVIDQVITVSKPTHFTNVAISGACAIACAVSTANKKDVTKEEIIEAGKYGARVGNEKAIEVTGKISAGPSIEKRIDLAVQVAKAADSYEELLLNLSDIVGTGVWVTESVPCVFGLIEKFDDPMQAILAAVNIGSDTDTIATMTGAILGSFRGVETLDQILIKEALEANDIEIEPYAIQLVELLCQN